MNLPALPFGGINVEGDIPPDASMFGEIQFPVGNVQQMDLAARRYREEGAIRVIVNWQRGLDIKGGLKLAGLLAAMFRSKKFDGVQTWVPSVPVVDDRNDNGVYFPVSFSVPYHFYFTDDAGFYA